MENTEELGQILKETQKAIELSQDGNWIPLGIVSLFFSIIIFLLTYIWKQANKKNEQDHKETKKILKQNSLALTALEKIVTKHETKIDYIEKKT